VVLISLSVITNIGKIYKLQLLSVTAHLSHHNRYLFLQTLCWNDI